MGSRKATHSTESVDCELELCVLAVISSVASTLQGAEITDTDNSILNTG